jgi:hypothetical protein
MPQLVGVLVTTYEEWRVTGEPGQGYRPYSFTWSPSTRPGLHDLEGEARGFIALLKDVGETWIDGPHLHKRTVTVTDWHDAGPPPLNRPHPTCIDVTAIGQTPRSEWICSPECPKEA